MSNAATNEGQGAKRAGRLVSRALLVLGGAVAGTAAAWLVSTATASADTLEVGTGSVPPVADATAGSLGDVNHGAARFAGDVAETADCHQDATTWSEPQASCAHTESRAIGHEVTDRVGDSVSDVTDSTVLSPVQRTLGAFEHIARQPEDTRQVIEETIAPAPAQDFGRTVWQLIDPARRGNLVPFPALPGLDPAGQPVSTGIGQAAGPIAESFLELPAALRAVFATPAGFPADAGMARSAGESRDGHRDVPSPLDPAQLPVAPSVPTAPGAPSAPGGHLDGLNFGVPSWVAAAVDNAVASAYRGGLRHTPRTPGSQPGVTPD